MIAIKIGGGNFAYIDPKRIIMIQGVNKNTMGGERIKSEIFVEGLKEPIYSIMCPVDITNILIEHFK